MATPTTPEEFYDQENGKNRTTVDPVDNPFVGDGDGVNVDSFIKVFAQLNFHMTREQLVQFAEMKRAVELARQSQRGRRT